MENLNILYNLLHILLPLSTGLTIWITTSWITGVKYLWIWTSCYLDYHGYSMHYHHFINSVNCCGKVFYCTENGITGGDINDTRNSSTAYIYISCMHWSLFLTTPWRVVFNSIPPVQNGRHFPDDIFRCIFVNEKFCILIKMSLKFVPKGPIHTKPSWV